MGNQSQMGYHNHGMMGRGNPRGIGASTRGDKGNNYDNLKKIGNGARIGRNQGGNRTGNRGGNRGWNRGENRGGNRGGNLTKNTSDWVLTDSGDTTNNWDSFQNSDFNMNNWND